MKIVLLGGSGLLGQQLSYLNSDILAPKHSEVDVTDGDQVNRYLAKIQPEMVIHAAAITDNRLVESDPADAIRTNIIGTAHIALNCLKRKIRLVYISTDYVYKGDRGNYKETDELLPFNKYAWTKLGGEASVQCVENHLIIRTSFGPAIFPYRQAFSDKWTSKDYVDVIAPLILEASLSPLTGILNLGTERKTIYSYALARNNGVRPINLQDKAYNSPYDTSFDLQKWLRFKGAHPVSRSHDVCRICGSGHLVKYLDLGLMPLANNLANHAVEAQSKDRFPLQVLFCQDCALSQLSVVIDPNVMFSYYTYRSSISKTYAIHCQDMAQYFVGKMNLGKDDFVMDIAGNDGTLLLQFQNLGKGRLLNIEPASNISAISRSRGIPVMNDFWSEDVARRVIAERGNAKLITATNVFAHVDDVHAFLHAVSLCMHDQGLLVLEFPYLVDFMQNREYDTVYFEHLSYFLITPLKRLVEKNGMIIHRISHFPIHGGTIRIEVSKGYWVEDATVSEYLGREERGGYLATVKYHEWAQIVEGLVGNIRDQLVALKRNGATIGAFAASAKGNTLLNACKLSTNIIDWIIDDTPEKIGKYSPGNAIPIVSRSVLEKQNPDYLLILSWNFKDEIIRSLPNYHGRFIIPIPEFTILNSIG